MIVGVAHQKGGVGKTTLSVNLAEQLKADILDQDLQQSCVLWNQRRKAYGGKEFVCMTTAKLSESEQIVNQYRASGKNLVVDCGGYDSENNRMVLLKADIIITPVSPSQVELDGLAKFMSIIDKANQQTGRTIVPHIVINNADVRSKTAIEELREFIANDSRFSLFKTVVHARADFRNSFAAGVSVVEMAPKTKAAEEVKSLVNEIKKAFKNIK